MTRKVFISYVTISLLSSLFFLSADAAQLQRTVVPCNRLLLKLCIDKDIHAIIGWKRVCNNGKLIYYTCDGKNRNRVLLNKACNCLTKGEHNDNNVNSFYIFKEE